MTGDPIVVSEKDPRIVIEPDGSLVIDDAKIDPADLALVRRAALQAMRLAETEGPCGQCELDDCCCSCATCDDWRAVLDARDAAAAALAPTPPDDH